MSSQYRLSASAIRDVDNLVDYSLKHHGKKQTRQYVEGLFATFNLIVKNPEIGSDQSVILDNIRRIVFRRHSVFYRIETDQIIVVRILGPGQDPLHIFKN